MSEHNVTPTRTLGGVIKQMSFWPGVNEMECTGISTVRAGRCTHTGGIRVKSENSSTTAQTRERPNPPEEHGGKRLMGFCFFSVYQLFLINWKLNNNKNII